MHTITHNYPQSPKQVFIGSCDENITEVITTQLMERSEKESQVSNPLTRFFCVALGLLFLGVCCVCLP